MVVVKNIRNSYNQKMNVRNSNFFFTLNKLETNFHTAIIYPTDMERTITKNPQQKIYTHDLISDTRTPTLLKLSISIYTLFISIEWP